MEAKWISIAIAAVFVAIAAENAVDRYSESQCKMAYTQSNRSADDIAKICK